MIAPVHRISYLYAKNFPSLQCSLPVRVLPHSFVLAPREPYTQVVPTPHRTPRQCRNLASRQITNLIRLVSASTHHTPWLVQQQHAHGNRSVVEVNGANIENDSASRQHQTDDGCEAQHNHLQGKEQALWAKSSLIVVTG